MYEHEMSRVRETSARERGESFSSVLARKQMKGEDRERARSTSTPHSLYLLDSRLL
jgi:hypothetical protein